MQQNGSKYFTAEPRQMEVGSKGLNSTFSEQGHVA